MRGVSEIKNSLIARFGPGPGPIWAPAPTSRAQPRWDVGPFAPSRGRPDPHLDLIRGGLARQTSLAEDSPAPHGTSNRRPPDRASLQGEPMPADEEATRTHLERARGGDPDAFAWLFAQYRPGIERLCRRLLLDAASAEDATGEVFLRARRALASVDPARAFGPWLRTIATNYCLDQLRRRRTERSLFDASDLSGESLADDRPGALQAITHHQERQSVLDALDRLPAKYRVPLVLRFYRDLDYAEIADVLGVSRNQVGTLLHRAKHKLRLALAESDAPGEETSAELHRAPSAAPAPRPRRKGR